MQYREGLSLNKHILPYINIILSESIIMMTNFKNSNQIAKRPQREKQKQNKKFDEDLFNEGVYVYFRPKNLSLKFKLIEDKLYWLKFYAFKKIMLRNNQQDQQSYNVLMKLFNKNKIQIQTNPKILKQRFINLLKQILRQCRNQQILKCRFFCYQYISHKYHNISRVFSLLKDKKQQHNYIIEYQNQQNMVSVRNKSLKTKSCLLKLRNFINIKLISFINQFINRFLEVKQVSIIYNCNILTQNIQNIMRKIVSNAFQFVKDKGIGSRYDDANIFSDLALQACYISRYEEINHRKRIKQNRFRELLTNLRFIIIRKIKKDKNQLLWVFRKWKLMNNEHKAQIYKKMKQLFQVKQRFIEKYC